MPEDTPSRGFEAPVLTNAMKPMLKHSKELLRLHQHYGPRLTLRVSLDHYGRYYHELERGKCSWAPAIDGLQWLCPARLRDQRGGADVPR